MTKEGLFEALGEIDGAFVAEAEKKPVFHAFPAGKVGRSAVILCAAVLLGFGAAWGVRAWRGSTVDGTDGWLPSLFWQEKQNEYVTPPVVTYRNCYYEILNMADGKALDRHGLPRRIAKEQVGDRVESLVADDGRRFTLYECAAFPKNQRAVYVAEEVSGEEKTYSYALFCNECRSDTRLCNTAEEMFAVIGVYAAGDIAYVDIGKRRLEKPEDVARFYEKMCGAEAMGEDGYQQAVFGRKSEREQQQLSQELADSAEEVRIGTRWGFCACGLDYEPTIGYVTWACNHYQTGTL